MERAAGIEPAWPVWKTGTLPLSYARTPARILMAALALSIRLRVLSRTHELLAHYRWSRHRPGESIGYGRRRPDCGRQSFRSGRRHREPDADRPRAVRCEWVDRLDR